MSCSFPYPFMFCPGLGNHFLLFSPIKGQHIAILIVIQGKHPIKYQPSVCIGHGKDTIQQVDKHSFRLSGALAYFYRILLAPSTWHRERLTRTGVSVS